MAPGKELLTKHFERCVFYFFPRVHALIDWNRKHEFLDKELRAITRRAVSGKRCVDLLVRVRLKIGKRAHILIHVEVQAQRDPKFSQRMYVYHYRAYDLSGQEVISLAILADQNQVWRPDRFGYEYAGKGVQFGFHTCKLIDFRAQENELRANNDLFAKVILAILRTLDTVNDPQKRMAWKFKFMTEMQVSGLEEEFVQSVSEALDGFMQLPHTWEQKLELKFQRFEAAMKKRRIPFYERIGRLHGEERGMRTAVLTVLNARFGRIPRSVRSAVEDTHDSKELNAMLRRVVKADSLEKFISKTIVDRGSKASK